MRLQLRGVATPQLSGVDLDLPAGACIALTAASGTGKTRLLRAIADLDEHRGRIAVDGREAAAWEAPAWRRTVGLLPAESQWWHDTPAAHFHEIDEARLQALGLQPEVMQRPMALLSTGERQRLALLRLLANHPGVLLLDEPTGALDDRNTRRVEALIAAYRRDTDASVLWVSHDADQGRRVASRHLTIAGGRLIEGAQWS